MSRMKEYLEDLQELDEILQKFYKHGMIVD